MIGVEQRLIFDAETGQQGDCLKCCLASVLELAYEQVPHFAAMEDWHGSMIRWLKDRGWSLYGVQSAPRDANDDPQRPRLYPHGGYWLARVISPRILNEDGTRGEHIVVMQEDGIAWDPHPLRDEGHLGFLDGYVFRAIDPARLVLREPIIDALRIIEENTEGESWSAGVAMSALESLRERALA